MQTISQTIESIKLPAEKSLIGVLAVAAVVATVGLAFVLKPTQAASIELPTADESRLIELTNIERSKAGLKALTYNSDLHEAALAKATNMLADDYFEHIAPSGKTPWNFIDAAGYRYIKAGENLAIDFTTVDGPVPAWMASPTHRANVLKPEYKEIGIAQVTGEFQGRQTTIVVQMFGAR